RDRRLVSDWSSDVCSSDLTDARGAPLRSGAQRTYEVGDDLRGHVAPGSWRLRLTEDGDLLVEFGRPLDHALLARCLRVVDAAGGEGRGAWRGGGGGGGVWG